MKAKREVVLFIEGDAQVPVHEPLFWRAYT